MIIVSILSLNTVLGNTNDKSKILMLTRVFYRQSRETIVTLTLLYIHLQNNTLIDVKIDVKITCQLL